MTRRTRPAALLSAAALLAGAGLSLALAPSASADPNLGSLSASPAAPVAGDRVSISGDGCVSVPTLPSAAAATSSAATSSAAPSAAADDTPGSVSITITGPDGFNSTDSATASPDGTWNGDAGIQVGGKGTYTVDATCTLVSIGSTGTDAAAAVTVGYRYDPLTLEVSAPPQVVDPSVTCTPGDGDACAVTAGGSATLTGIGFPASTTATVTLDPFGSQSAPVDTEGGFSGVSFPIPDTQGSGTLTGSVSAPGVDAVPFTVAVTAKSTTTTTPPPSVDGTVPTGSGDTDTSGTDATAGDGTDYSDTSGTNYTSTAPTLPNTGVDSVWPGVIGGVLVLAGGALLWAGRRRDEAGSTAV